MAQGIKDKVAIIGMGCSKFGERWDMGAEGLIVEAYEECIADAGIEKKDIQAAWLGTTAEDLGLGRSAIPLGITLRLPNIPITRVENYCATGTEAFRGAVYAVASGACDIALAVGVEKLKDTGFGGLPELGSGFGSLAWQWFPHVSTPGLFAQLAVAYSAKYNLDMKEIKRAMAHIAVKSHAHGALNPKAHLQKPITMEQVLAAPMIAYPVGLFDCCGVSDGAACAIVTTPEIAAGLGKKNIISVKALQVAVSSGYEGGFNKWDGDHFVTADICSGRAYREAGIEDPRRELSLLELHDCFSITELVTYEDLHISDRGKACYDVMDGFYDSEGKLPAQIDGGLKCFGHPVGASGIRMIYEIYLQLQGRAGKRQLADPQLGLTHNIGGFPHQNVCAISIIGQYKKGVNK